MQIGVSLRSASSKAGFFDTNHTSFLSGRSSSCPCCLLWPLQDPRRGGRQLSIKAEQQIANIIGLASNTSAVSNSVLLGARDTGSLSGNATRLRGVGAGMLDRLSSIEGKLGMTDAMLDCVSTFVGLAAVVFAVCECSIRFSHNTDSLRCALDLPCTEPSL